MFGRTNLATNSVMTTRVSADGKPKYKPGGVTIDWDKVTAINADATLTDGSVIKSGQKYLRYGQVLTKITASGKYGPYDPSVTDGRELLTRGRVYILDETLIQYNAGSSGLGAANDHAGGVFEGGLVWIDRVLHSGTGTHTLAAGPTLAEVLTAFPELRQAKND